MRGPSVLVVDDDADTREVLRLVLEPREYVVALAKDGCQALERATAFRPEIILLDLSLPDVDGYAVAERLRNMPEAKRALLIALSGHSPDEERARGVGLDAHLTKPIEPDTLLTLLSVFSKPAA